MPKKGKGHFIFRPTTNPTTADASASVSHDIPPPTLISSGASLNLEQLTVAADEITRASRQQPVVTPRIPGTWSGTSDPNSMPTSAPSSYLSPSVASESTSSAVTSVSRAKRKVSPSVTDSVASIRKWSRPLSATAQAQQVGGAAMQELAAVVKDISHSIAPPDALGAAINILQQHHELTPIQRLDISEYLVLEQNKNQAILFHKFGEEEWKVWLAHRLFEITASQHPTG